MKDLEYVNLVKKTIRDVVLEYSLPIYNIDYVEQNPFEVQLSIEPSLFFEVLLLTIRRETVSFGIKKKRAEKQKEEELQLQILKNEIELDKSGSYVTMQKLEEQKKELENIREHRQHKQLNQIKSYLEGIFRETFQVLSNVRKKKI